MRKINLLKSRRNLWKALSVVFLILLNMVTTIMPVPIDNEFLLILVHLTITVLWIYILITLIENN